MLGIVLTTDETNSDSADQKVMISRIEIEFIRRRTSYACAQEGMNTLAIQAFQRTRLIMAQHYTDWTSRLFISLECENQFLRP